MSKPAFSASVVVEWYNATRATYSRGQQTLAELARQAGAILRDADGLAFALTGPIELIITYNADALAYAQVESTVRRALPEPRSLDLRLAPVPGGTYCAQKNHGVLRSSGDIVIFLDSDVVPEPGWLGAMLAAFCDPEVEAVVGNTFVDYGDGRPYSKALALTWMFPLASDSDRCEIARSFYANNAAFRREVVRARPFEDVPGFMHAAARRFVSRLENDRIKLWSVGSARASHPPPNGPRHFCMRAVAGGRARALDPTAEGPRSVADWVISDLRLVGYHAKVILRDGYKVGLTWWQKPSAVLVASAYDLLFLAGSLLSRLFPGVMRRRFDL